MNHGVAAKKMNIDEGEQYVWKLHTAKKQAHET